MVEHYAYGLWTPVLAYAVSVLGSFLGLRCATRARGRGGPGQAGWIAMGAVSIGGVGVWAMHFIAMLGFRIHGAPIRYDLTLTVVSAVIPMAVMALALYLIIVGGRRWALPVSGAVVAVGVVSMHYLGMASMNGHAGWGTTRCSSPRPARSRWWPRWWRSGSSATCGRSAPPWPGRW